LRREERGKENITDRYLKFFESLEAIALGLLLSKSR
jgi:hypothetical protein